MMIPAEFNQTTSNHYNCDGPAHTFAMCRIYCFSLNTLYQYHTKIYVYLACGTQHTALSKKNQTGNL